jgi:hypothetical protein
MFSEDDTFVLSEWVVHRPGEVLSKNFGLDETALAKLPKDSLYIFPADLPKSLAQDRAARWKSSCPAVESFQFVCFALCPNFYLQNLSTQLVFRTSPASINGRHPLGILAVHSVGSPQDHLGLHE